MSNFFYDITYFLGGSVNEIARRLPIELRSIILKLPSETVRIDEVSISSFESLQQAIGAQHDHHIFVLLNEKYERVSCDCVNPLLAASSYGNGIIYLKVQTKDITPTTSPSKNGDEVKSLRMEAPLPPQFLQDMIKEIHYAELPVALNDQTTEDLVGAIQDDEAEDNPLILVMGPPGSGKTFAVRRACQQIPGCVCFRKKICISHEATIRRILKNAIPANTYDERVLQCTELLDETFSALIDPLHMSACKARKELDTTRIVIHLDDIQGLMTEKVVCRHATVSDDLRDYAFISLCHKIVRSFDDVGCDVRVVLSGTNFFAEASLNLGSFLKSTRIPVEGVFPLSWLSTEVIVPFFSKYCSFDLEDYEADVSSLLYDVAQNRRCTHRALWLQQNTLKRSGKKVSWEEFRRILSSNTESAFNWWKGTLKMNFGRGISVAAARTISFLLFRDQYGGIVDPDTGNLCCNRIDVPAEVLSCAVDEAVHCIVECDQVIIRPPRGVVKRLLLEEFKRCMSDTNRQQLKSIRVVAESVRADVGTGGSAVITMRSTNTYAK
jgi:hypothetical protein